MTSVYRLLAAGLLMLSLCQCASGPSRWDYDYKQGSTAIIVDGKAVPPAGLPKCVNEAIEAGNRIAGKPYRYGGGHRHFEDKGYDCSGCVSYVLHAMNCLEAPSTSDELRHFGEKGEGKHVTVWAKDGHALIVVAGLRLDTGYHGGDGPRWTQKPRSLKGYKARHPKGL